MTVRYVIRLPWPDKRLGANAMRRSHWTQKARLIKGARLAAANDAIYQGARRIRAKAANVSITLHPPDKRHRDPPNWQYACKAAIDGVSDIIGIDDHKWKITWIDGEPVRPDGAVIMEIESA